MQIPKNNGALEKKRNSSYVVILFALIIEGLFCVIWLLSIPSNPGGLIFGLSLNRLLLLSTPLVSSLLFLAILLLSFFKKAIFQKMIGKFSDLNFIRIIFIFAALLSITSWCVLFFFNLLNYVKYQYLSERSLPLIVWGVVTGLTILVSLYFYQKNKLPAARSFDYRILLPIILIILVLFSLPLLTGIGLYTRDITVNDLGIPLLEWQIVFTIGLLILLSYIKAIPINLELFKKEKFENIQKYLPLIFFVVFWLSAFILWQKQPLPINNYFAPRVLPPNFETYPFSDAERYSLDRIRIINGITSNFIISKPFHAIYLAILNYLGHLNYQNVILGQTLILAFFPSILFLIGKEIRGNMLGLGMGIFAIFREINALQAANIANVANSKLLLSDFPSTLILSLLILYMIRWVKNRDGRYYPFILGGILGILILYRAQYLIFIPVFIVIAFLLYWKNIKRIMLFSGIFILFLSAIVLPLLIRNHSISGIFWFDSSDYISGFAENYVMADPENIDSDINTQNPSFSENQPEGRSDLVGSLVKSNYIIDITDNFFRNLVSTFLIFPIRIDGSQDIQELSVIKDNFWAEAFQYNSQLNLIIAIFNLSLLIIGLYLFILGNWKVAISCLLIYLTQNLSSALFRFSGWRFIMPVDWMVLFIYIIGIFGLFGFLRLIPRTDQNDMVSKSVSMDITGKNELKAAIPFLVIFLLIGSILPLRELFSTNTQATPKSDVCSNLENSISKDKYPLVREKAILLCADENSTALEGVIIYPRFFERGQGFYDISSDIFYGKQDFSRMIFRFAADDISKLYLPLSGIKDNIRIANGSPAFILAATGQIPKVQLIVLKERKDILFYSDELLAN